MIPITSPLDMPLFFKYRRVTSSWMYSQSNSEVTIFVLSVWQKYFKQSSDNTPSFSASSFADLIWSQILPPRIMISPSANCISRHFNFASPAWASANLKGSTFQLLYLLLRVVGLGAGFEYGAQVFFEASPECFRKHLDFYGGSVASPLVLTVLKSVVV